MKTVYPTSLAKYKALIARVIHTKGWSVTHRQAVKYMMVGVVNTAVDIIAYVLLTRTTNVFVHHLVVAKFLSFLVGTVSSLILNRYWTFNVRARLRFVDVVRFYSAISASLPSRHQRMASKPSPVLPTPSVAVATASRLNR